jgi:hypothetical protein
MNMGKELWEVLVPTMSRDGKPFRTRFHRVWDKKVEAISGGLTILTPGKGTWVHEEQTVRERMIPVRVMCTREQIDQIVDLTLEYYDQLAVMAYRVSDEIILKHRTAKKGKHV